MDRRKKILSNKLYIVQSIGGVIRVFLTDIYVCNLPRFLSLLEMERFHYI